MKQSSLSSFPFLLLVQCLGGILILPVLLLVTPCHSFSSSDQLRTSNGKQSLFPYQLSGVERLISGKNILLADQMGLGKTCQAISALNRLGRMGEINSGEARILVICPKSVLNVWVDELNDWLDPRLELDVKVCTAGSSPEDPSIEGIIQLINYDICDKHKEILQARRYDVLICDEGHYLKSHKSKRTKAILGNVSGRKGAKARAKGIQSRYLWILTGTPIMNRPVELYPLLHALDPDGWEPMSNFIDRYCEPKLFRGKGGRRWGTSANGASNLGELQERLKPYMVRRYKADVLSDLPPKLRSCVNLADGFNAAAQERKLVAEMMGMGDVAAYTQQDVYGEDYDGELESPVLIGLESFGAKASTLIDYGIKPSDFKDERFLGSLAKIRKQTALLKIEPAVQLLKDIIACEKVVVFAHHRQIILDLVEHFGKQCVHIIGGMDTESRAEAVRRFQKDDGVRLFIGSIRAAGVGVTLTAASHVIFLEMDWSPAVMAQAEDRCHRVGQQDQDSVLCQYYVFRDTIDEWIAKKLIAKEAITKMALPTDTDAESSRQRENYQLDFGKHKGLRLEDVPEDYLSFIVSNDLVWRKRPALWRALYVRGLVRDEPLSAREDEESVGKFDGSKVRDSGSAKVDYTFDFGKHRGEEWDDVPISYRGWILKNNVWKSRSDLKKALIDAGVIN